MAKVQSTYPTTIDTTLQTDRASGDTITSDSYDIIEDAIFELENKVGVDSSAVSGSLDYQAARSKVKEVHFCVPLTLATGDQAPWIHMSFAGTIQSVYAIVKTVSSGGTITVDILKSTSGETPSWSTIFSTKITIDQSEYSTETAAAPAVLSVTSFGVDNLFRINIDGAGTGAAWLSVSMKVTPS